LRAVKGFYTENTEGAEYLRRRQISTRVGLYALRAAAFSEISVSSVFSRFTS